MINRDNCRVLITVTYFLGTLPRTLHALLRRQKPVLAGISSARSPGLVYQSADVAAGEGDIKRFEEIVLAEIRAPYWVIVKQLADDELYPKADIVSYFEQ